ncbi:hypothetical protein Taro_014143 [Colocasia esculenta]|uniref:DNA-directed RNA polymerase n=1 Tax=Colocasia esculenta TaxID=4460 RepID=A0A843U8C2_COLES|nr:hypothetical protein [Colocasia esculenta]
MQRAEVMIKDPGPGRDAALRVIRRSGILLSFVRDVTPMPHSGCRPPKKDEIAGSTRTLQWKCVESRIDSKRLYYGRFVLSPLMKGQVDTIGIAMRRILLEEIEGTCITRAKSEKVPHEYSTLVGIEESVHEILMNLKEIVLRSNLYGTRDASICVKGPRYITAQDIILPPSVEIVYTTQHIATLTEPLDLCIGLQIQRDRGYRMRPTNNSQDGSYPIDVVSMPVRNANHSIYSYGNGNEKQEIFFLEIWTNGSLTPKEALHEASLNLKKNKKEIALKCIFIDQSELPSRTYNCLKRSNIYILLDLLSNSQEDLMKVEYFRIEDVKQIVDILQKYFTINLPKTKFSF